MEAEARVVGAVHRKVRFWFLPASWSQIVTAYYTGTCLIFHQLANTRATTSEDQQDGGEDG